MDNQAKENESNGWPISKLLKLNPQGIAESANKVCKDYWQLDDEGSFTNTVIEIAE